MFRGSGPGCVQNFNSEHFRGSIYRTIFRMEAKMLTKTEWKASGPARPAGEWNSYFIRGLQISAGILSLGLTRLEPRWGRRISVRFAEAAALPCVQNMRGASVIILSLILSLILILIKIIFIIIIIIIMMRALRPVRDLRRQGRIDR